MCEGHVEVVDGKQPVKRPHRAEMENDDAGGFAAIEESSPSKVSVWQHWFNSIANAKRNLFAIPKSKQPSNRRTKEQPEAKTPKLGNRAGFSSRKLERSAPQKHCRSTIAGSGSGV